MLVMMEVQRNGDLEMVNGDQGEPLVGLVGGVEGVRDGGAQII